MSDQTQEVFTDHAYDGIREYDNPTPGWWTWLFIVTIVFSAIYYLFVTLAGGQLSPTGFYERSVTADLQRQFAELGELQPDAATILKYSRDEKWLKVGRSLFASKCVACHGADGQGNNTAPNLTDNYYINVRKVDDIPDVIRKGRNNGAMPAQPGLRQNELVLVSSYVASLRGKNKDGAKPQGDVIPQWEP